MADENEEAQLILMDAAERMEKSVAVLRHESASIRAGRANPDMLDAVRVEVYGSAMPLNQLATVSAPDARLLVVQPFDKSNVGAIEKELLRADLSLRQRISDAARNSFLDKFYRLILDYGIRAKVLHYIPNASASELMDAAESASSLVDAIEARDEEECDRIVISMLGRERRILSRFLEPRFGEEIRLPPPVIEESAAA